MTWQTKYVGDIDLKNFRASDHPIGTVFNGPTLEEIAADPERKLYNGWFRLSAQHLSEFYKANNTHRKPLFVILPGFHLFCIDGQCWSGGEHYGGWTVTGEPEAITVSPSINIGGCYHGFLKDGVISDDVEGRTYNDEGYQNYVDDE